MVPAAIAERRWRDGRHRWSGGTQPQGGTAAGGGSPGAAGADAFAAVAAAAVRTAGSTPFFGIATTGGNGGKGGDASDLIYPSFAAGGGGGAGGYGVVFTGLAGTLSASANVTGGNGGDGGDAELNGRKQDRVGGSGALRWCWVVRRRRRINIDPQCADQGRAGGAQEVCGLQGPLGFCRWRAQVGAGGAGISAQSGATLERSMQRSWAAQAAQAAKHLRRAIRKTPSPEMLVTEALVC